MNPIPHILRSQTFWLSPERCMYWEEERALVVADLHLGKSGHFRRSGIAVPQHVYKADLQRLIACLYFYKAERLIIVGDMTHSSHNKELDLFVKWRNDFSSLHIDLVKGNHDILEDQWYNEANIKLHEWEYEVNGFLFRHEHKKRPLTDPPVLYTFTGHVHPGIVLRGAGKQSLRFPCFYFGEEGAILPAFSRFTGTYTVKPEKGEMVYALTGEGIIKF